MTTNESKKVVSMSTIVAEVSGTLGMTKSGTKKVIDEFLRVVENHVAEGDKVSLFEHFSLAVVERAERMGHNPKTGESIKIPAYKTVKFSASSALKDKVNK